MHSPGPGGLKWRPAVRQSGSCRWAQRSGGLAVSESRSPIARAERADPQAAAPKREGFEPRERERSRRPPPLEAERVLHSIAAGTSAAVGPDFFACLVRNVAETLGVRYVVVVEHLDSPPTRVRALAFWMGDHLVEDFEYDLAGTPCQEVAGGASSFYARDLQRRFPDDRELVRLGAHSYCGIPLIGTTAPVIGHLAVLDVAPLAWDPCELPALPIFAARAAAELERQRLDEQRRRAQEQVQQLNNQLLHLARVTTLGEMTAGLVHEVSTPLTLITNYARKCLRRLKAAGGVSGEVVGEVESLLGQAVRAEEFVERLRSFVRKAEPQRSVVRLADVLREMSDLIQTEARSRGTAVRLRLSAHLPALWADKIQIQQVLLNLIRNGCEAQEECRPADRRLEISAAAVPGQLLEVAVRDAGKGIPPAVVKHLFTPFHSTKRGGLGMGLALSRSIIEAHGGTLWTTANPEGGTTFRFTVPVAAKG